jgi:hypothetical protein
MDFGQQRLQQQDAARQMMYQNSGYQFERRDKKTLILDIADDGTTNPLSKSEVFSADLFEPLIIDKLSDIYLDSFMTHNALVCRTGNRMAFALQINEFNINSNSASNSSTARQQAFNSIIIPNDHNSINDVHSCVVHKGKKLNYVCSINPGRISKISGKISDLSGSSMFTTGDGNDGGKLYYVKLSAVLTRAVDTDKIITFSANTNLGNFKTAFGMALNATDLYFYSDGGSISTSDTGTAMGNATVDGLTAKATLNNTFRAGDFPRCIAEFVIVARE